MEKENGMMDRIPVPASELALRVMQNEHRRQSEKNSKAVKMALRRKRRQEKANGKQSKTCM